MEILKLLLHLKKLDEQLKAQGLDPDNLQDAITDSLKTQAGRDLLMANGDNLDDLEVYTQSLLPSKALKAKGDGVLGKIVVTGYVFDTGEVDGYFKEVGANTAKT